ncbi:hypothetical protein [Nocardia pseudovaccinii]|uniref:hypothetical protein n=1 Tax=Nocardia pseudovaccinii TaxID=189540 RepID=UPI0007A42B97|nr:hypothetical protein [Nocardia pseudovaccinii]
MAEKRRIREIGATEFDAAILAGPRAGKYSSVNIDSGQPTELQRQRLDQHRRAPPRFTFCATFFATFCAQSVSGSHDDLLGFGTKLFGRRWE